VPAESIADARDPSGSAQAAPSNGAIPSVARPRLAPPAVLMPLGLTLMGLGLLLTMGGSVIGWRRGGRPAWATRALLACDEVVLRATRLVPSGTWSTERWRIRWPGAWTDRLTPVSALAREKATAAAERLVDAARRVRPTR
jgi:hypothetical protein